MIAAVFHLRSAASLHSAGPLSFGDVRGLLQAGLISGNTMLADDDFRFHPLRDYPELWAALHDPEIGEVELAPKLALDRRPDVARERDTTTAAPILNPTENDLVDFDAVRRGERGYSVYDSLALNRVNEPEKVVVMPPWWKRPRVKDLRNWLILSGVLGGLFYFRYPGSLNPFELGAYALIFGGGTWHIFVISPHGYGRD